MNKVLFIGGPLDGQRRVWDTQGYAIRTIVPNDQWKSSDASFGFEEHHYQLQEGFGYRVAVHSTVKNIMEALIKGYRHYRKPMTEADRYRRNLRRLQKIAGYVNPFHRGDDDYSGK